MSLASVEGEAISRMRVQVPAWGLWWADIDIPKELDLSGSVLLTLADITLQGAIISGGVFDGTSSYRVAGGAGGWGKVIPSSGYVNSAGIKVSTILQDAATQVGETLANVPTTQVGTHYTRVTGVASRVLHELAPQAWFVDFTGVTQFGARPQTEYVGDGSRVHVDPGVRVIDVATDEIATLVPGVTVDGSSPATDVEYVLDTKRLTARVYSGGATSRRLDSFEKMLDALDPNRKYRGTFEFRVATQTGSVLSLQPVRAATGMPDLENVTARIAAGIDAEVTLGELVLVSFVDADPSRPVVVGHDDAGAPGGTPKKITLSVSNAVDGIILGGSDPVIRKSDFDAHIISFNLHNHGGAVPSVPLTAPAGSTKVTAG